MSVAERVHWDHYYQRQKGGRNYPSPDPLLFEYVPPLTAETEARAVDIACGYAQNALWLATQGYTTDALDISRVALTVAQARVARAGIRGVNLLPVDLDTHQLPKAAYDVAIVARFIKRGLMPDIRACVRPGGRVIYYGYNTRHLNQDPDYDTEQLFRPGELLGYFADWRVLHHSNTDGVSQLIAVKPRE